MNSQSRLPARRKALGVFGRGPALRFLAASFALYLRLVFRTARVEIHYPKSLAARLGRGTGVLAVHWHGGLALAMLFGLGLASNRLTSCWPFKNTFAGLVKPNAEGLLFKACLAQLRIPSVDSGAGSAKRTRAVLAQGMSLITPADGPRGPCMQASDRIVRFGLHAGAILVPFGCAASSRIRFGTWDRFVLPLPFTRLVYVIGEPIALSPDGDETAIEGTRKQLECALNDLTANANRLSGHP